jgi:hypothetical protein
MIQSMQWRRRLVLRALALAVALIVSGPPAAAVAEIAAPTAAQLAAFRGSPEDAPAKELLGIKGFEGRHYLVGDEWYGHLWLPHIQNLGGGYIGVGTDQAYLFIGWARPDFAWLIDYDVLVVELHSVYRALFLEAADPDAFIALWQDAAAGKAAIDRHSAADPRIARLHELYRRNRSSIAYRLSALRKRLRKEKVAAYLTDGGTYQFVRDSIAAGRVRPMSTNLLADKGLAGIGEAARQMGVPIRLTYLSNAEQYWPYSKQFRANLRGLPYDERSILIRTLSTFTINKDYRYNVQPGLAYQDFLGRSWLTHVHRMIPRRALKGPDDIELLVYTTTADEIEKRRGGKARKGKAGEGKADKGKADKGKAGKDAQ